MRTRLPRLAAALLLCACLPGAALAENRALILGISNYVRQPLPGVAKDMDNARRIARLIGVPEKNITVRTDEQLAGQGLMRELDAFASTINKGDNVFVYYSGHGSSYSKPDHPGQCEKALVGQDITFISKQEFHQKVAALAARADKTFVFLDSCYSGGMMQENHTRGLGLPGGPTGGAPNAVEANAVEAWPKFAAAAPGDPCSKAANVKAVRDYDLALAEATPNYYLLGSAAGNEVAIDGGAQVGGFASSAVLSCLEQSPKADLDGDGLVTLDEVRRCAQQSVDARLEQGQQASANFPYTSMTLTAGFGQGGNPPVAFSAGDDAVLNAPAFVQALFDARDATRAVALHVDKNPIRIGQDLNLTLLSDRPGHVTLMAVGSSGKIYKLFPNKLDADARVEANTPLQIPRPLKWRLPASAPAGDNWLLVLVSDKPDRFKDLGEDAGIFKKVENTGKGARGFFDFLFKPADNCAKAVRDFDTVAVDPCSTAYGAALLKVVEIE